MRTTRRRETRHLATAAVLAALATVLLGVGALFDVLDISMAFLASLTVTFAVIELGGYYPYLVYLATSVLAFLLLPNKSPALFFAAFTGYYPILKYLFESYFARPVAWLFKFFSFAVAVLAAGFLAVRVLSLFEWVWNPLFLLLIPLSLLFFFLYDVALTRLITVYLVRLARYFRFLHRE